MPVFEERLRQLGAWLKVNGEAIYESRPWKHQNDTTNPDVWYTMKGDSVYGTLLKYPGNNQAVFSSVRSTDATEIELLGYDERLQWSCDKSCENGVVIDLSDVKFSKLPSEWAWTFKLTYVV